MWQEFRAFIARGNVIDLAVGVVMGAAFNAIVNSLVNDIVMPPIGLLLAGVNFSDLFFALDGKSYASLQAAQQAGAPVWAWGRFIQAVLNFSDRRCGDVLPGQRCQSHLSQANTACVARRAKRRSQTAH